MRELSEARAYVHGTPYYGRLNGSDRILRPDRVLGADIMSVRRLFSSKFLNYRFRMERKICVVRRHEGESEKLLTDAGTITAIH